MDTDLYRATNRFADHTTWLHGPLSAYARYGIVLFAAALLASWWVSRAADDLEALAGAAWAGAAALGALGVGQLLGNIIDRSRPYETIPQAHVLIARTTDFSFPSDHATAAAAVAAGLVIATRRIGLVAAAAALLMALARVYVGAHYPADVAAGLVLGAAVAALGHRLVVPHLTRLLRHLATTPLRPLLTSRPQADPQPEGPEPR